MRTLILLTALLLLAFQAQAQTLQETADQGPTQDQPGAKDQDLLGDEDQDVVISFTGEERLTRQLPGRRIFKKIAKLIGKILRKTTGWVRKVAKRKSCICRPQDQCPDNKVNKVLARVSWVCRIFGRQYKLCCN